MKTNEALDFILTDMQKESAISPAKLWLYSLITLSIPVFLGLFLRRDWNDVFAESNWIPNLSAALCVGLFPILYQKRAWLGKKSASFLVFSLIASVLFAIHRLYGSTLIAPEFTNNTIFWKETSQCFEKGIFAVFLMGIWLTLFAFELSSLPSRQWRALTSITGGISAAVMLSFHCDSGSVEHVMLGHLGSGLCMGIVLFGLQELLFRAVMKKKLPLLSKRITGASSKL